jgi:hypothetical protein
MKRIITLLIMICTMGTIALAQEHVVEKKDKVHRTSTLGQKIHNTFHKKKHYSGYKVKHKERVEKVHK